MTSISKKRHIDIYSTKISAYIFPSNARRPVALCFTEDRKVGILSEEIFPEAENRSTNCIILGTAAICLTRKQQQHQHWMTAGSNFSRSIFEQLSEQAT